MRSLHRPALAGLLAGALLLLASCDASDESTPTATASATQVAATASASLAPTESVAASDGGSAGEETSVFDLEVGDCFTASGDEVETVTVVDCDESHVYEAFAIFDHEAGDGEPYPGDQELLEYADAACQSPFEDYVGIEYQSSIYWITSVTPSEETWSDGDREIVCTLKLGEEGQETTGSAEGTGQ